MQPKTVNPRATPIARGQSLAAVFLKAAKTAAEQNQYTCPLLLMHDGAKWQYQGMLGPVRISGPKTAPEAYWWNATCASEAINGTYAHNARVIALLLAYEAAKTGDLHVG